MIKRIVLTITTVFAGVAVGVLLALAGHSDSLAAAEPAPPPPQATSQMTIPQSDSGMLIPQEPAEATTTQGGYFIKEYGGRVSVIKDGSDVPEMIFDIQTKLLPEVDRQQLSQGIYVETYEELIRLVEDYIS